MGTQTERGRGIENPLKGEWERMKKWQPHKGAWNSLPQGPGFFAILYPSPLSPTLTLTLSLSHLAEAVLNLGTLTLCQAVMQLKRKLPGRTLRVSFKSACFSAKNSPTPSLDLPPVFGFHLLFQKRRAEERSDERMEGFKTSHLPKR